MGLLVRTLRLCNWRNFEERSFSFSGGMTILHGHNAVGKTNTIEALQLLTSGTSFRKPRPGELVREGCDCCRIAALFEGDGRSIDMVCDVENNRRHFMRNGKRCAPQSVPETLISVLFNPDDLSFVKRGASYRRDELDGFGRQANKGYHRLLSAYGRAVEQRNRLLKDETMDVSLLDAWDVSVATGGAALLHARLRLFRRLVDIMKDIYQEISEGETLECAYVSSLGPDIEGMEREELRELLLERLNENRAQDLRRQQTLVGPQRDDLKFLIAGRDARAYGSQGQQRSAVLAWKMAEVQLAREVLGQLPLLLLDDVMSELDEDRRRAMTRFIQGGIQTVVTTANLGYFPHELLEGAQVVDIGD